MICISNKNLELFSSLIVRECEKAFGLYLVTLNFTFLSPTQYVGPTIDARAHSFIVWYLSVQVKVMRNLILICQE